MKDRARGNSCASGRGLAERDFERRFQLADYVVVNDANLVNGLLSISLKRELPEALKPRRVEIGVGQPLIDAAVQRVLPAIRGALAAHPIRARVTVSVTVAREPSARVETSPKVSRPN